MSSEKLGSKLKNYIMMISGLSRGDLIMKRMISLRFIEMWDIDLETHCSFDDDSIETYNIEILCNL